MRRRALPAALALGLAFCSGWSLAQPATAPASSPPAPGQSLFQARCGGCHLDKGFGTRVLARRVDPGASLLEKRSDLTADYVRAVVRRGIGSMPMIRVEELPDTQLREISAYLGKGK